MDFVVNIEDEGGVEEEDNTIIKTNDEYLVKLQGSNPNAKDAYAKINLKYLPEVSEYNWYLSKSGYPFAYAKNGGRIMLHKFIWFLRTGGQYHLERKYVIDHINRDRLNATEQNLRLATVAENSYNKTYENEFHHIRQNAKTGDFEVTITKNKKQHRIGQIKTETEAKEIYNLMASELFGEFANLQK
jgi:hypothetical protein